MPSPVSPPPSALPDDEAPRVRPWTIWMLIGLIAIGGVVGTQILFKKVVPESLKKEQRLPYIGLLEKDLEATDASGNTVRLSQLDGKVLLIAYVYTTCPRGCADVVDKMQAIQQKFADDPRLHLVSVSLNPAHDTPEQLAKFCEAHGINRSNWWFLTGDEKALRYYMTSQVRLRPVSDIPEAERLSPEDKFDHDTRVALVDGLSHVRAHYEVNEPDPGISALVMLKLESDLKSVLAETPAPPAAR